MSEKPHARMSGKTDKAKAPAADEIGDLGITIPSETNAALEDVKALTGLSKAMVANMMLAHFAPRIVSGELEIVNGRIRPASRRQAA